jgi:O-antigen ligase
MRNKARAYLPLRSTAATHPSLLPRFLLYWPIVALPLILGSARSFLWSFVGSVFLAGFAIMLVTAREGFAIPWNEKRKTKGVNLDIGKGEDDALVQTLSRVPCFLLLLIVAYPFLQTIPLPLPLISLLSPQRAEWLHRSFEATGMSRWWASLSYVPVDTFMSGLWILTLALFALLLHRSIRDRIIEPRKLLAVLLAVAGLEALFGIIQVLVPSTGLGFSTGATGTFANRDHFAAFLGMIWPLQLAQCAGPWFGARGKRISWGEKEDYRKEREKQFFFLFLTGIVLLGLVFSRSRGGMIGLAVGTAVLLILGGKSRRSILPVLIGCWAIILAYGSIIGFEGIVKRFTEIGQDAHDRFRIWQFTWNLIRDHWLTGTGAGTYSPVVFLYQVFDTDLFQIGHAHNDYLEVASEWGVPFGLLICSLAWGYWLVSAIRLAGRKVMETGDTLIRLGALAGSAAFLSHSWVEFNWQIPANQLYFVTLLVLMRGKK